jgi:amidophosphoribosyltransferase
MGVDMATKGELIANRMKIDEIARHIGADSIQYLSLQGMLAVVRESAISRTGTPGHCSACFSGEYPIELPQWLIDDASREKLIFEGMWG